MHEDVIMSDRPSETGEVEAKLEIEALDRFVVLVDEIIGDLSGVISNREQDFLDLGGSLMEFTSRMGDLSGKASRLAEITAGGEIQEGIESLNAQLDDLSGVCKLDSSEQSLEELRSIGGVIMELDGHVVDFGRMVKKLTMLGISTRIESARLGSKGLGFATLADDVEKLAGKIVSNSERIMEKSKSLSNLIESATDRTAELVRLQGGCSEKIVSDLGKSLEGLERMVDRSDKAAANMSKRLSAIHSGVSGAVSSMQFHDIVRQQVEHVEESFVDAREMIVSSGMVRSGADNDHVEEDFLAAESRTEKARELIGWLHDVSGLQKSQLDNAAKRFNEAVENLISSMAGIGENVQLIGTEMGEVLSDEQEGGSVLDRIDEGASEIVGSMREFTSQGEEISELMGTVAETIKEMSEFVSDIEEVGSEIELISLNASVKAAHTGEEGKALGVLASSIQHLSTDAMDLTGKVTEVLREITAGSRRLEERAAEYVVSQDLEKLVSSQEETTSRLKALNADVVALFEEVSGESRELGTDIRELAEQTDIHHVVEEDLREISGKALQLIREAEQVVPDMEDAARSERLKELLGRYTMEAERLIHEAASSVRQVIAEPDEGFEEPAVAADDSGEIELFDDEPEQEGAEDGVELFDDGVELFGEEEGEEREREEALADERAEQEEEWDNVELF